MSGLNRNGCPVSAGICNTPKVGPKGQMTLPKDVRATLELCEGDRVLLRVEPDGKVVLEKAVIVAASKKTNSG